MRTILLSLASFLLSFTLAAQFVEDFDGPTLQSQHPWETNSQHFIINTAQQLQFTSSGKESGEESLATPISYSPDMTWNFDVKLDFHATVSNNLLIYVYGTDPQSDYTLFYIQVGNNKRQISFYEWGKTKEPRIVGRENLLDEPATFIRIVLTLEKNKTWTLYTCKEGESSFTKEGSYSKTLTHLREGGKLNLTFRSVKSRVSTYYIDRIRVYNTSTGLPETFGENTDIPSEPGLLPELTGLEALSDTEIRFVFSATVDITGAIFSVSGIGDAVRKIYGASEAIVNTRFAYPLVTGSIYTIRWSGLKNEEGQAMPPDSVFVRYEEEDGDKDDGDGEDPSPEQPGANEQVDPGQIVFNEILPNPFSDGSEYIELYNRTVQTLSLAGLYITTRKKDGSFGTHYSLSTLTDPLPSGGYALLTKEASRIKEFYSVADQEALHELKIPVLANTSSTIVLARNSDNVIIDELSYSSDWHTTLIAGGKGVALERIDPDGKTQDPGNWASATADAGYGTPGYRNSNRKEPSPGTPTGSETLIDRLSDDLYHIHYKVDLPGYFCQAALFDLSGRLLLLLPLQQLPEKEGTIDWRSGFLHRQWSTKGLCLLRIRLFHPEGREQIICRKIWN